MTQSTSKPATRPLVHHPSDVLDQFCQCDASSASWAKFDAQLSADLTAFEEAHRDWFTPKALLRTLGR
jgi:hypothetical protein